MRKRKGFYSISAVAQMFSVHQQTIRLYEREGLISPKRSEGNTRLFSEEDIERLEEIIYLTHKVGVNLAGVDLILKQQKKINRLQKEINSLFKGINDDLEHEKELSRQHLVKASEKLVQLKRHRKTPLHLLDKPQNIDRDDHD
ncbi:MAG: MerR family transcriptional regulator [Candidatus Babeliaceae bacterium]|nr:MerR family transcriptional regulator [Candidatus Babeliaceae bacterium]